MKNKMEDLRDHLFATLESLQDKDNPMDLDRAKTIVAVAGSLIDTARVEVQFIQAVGGQAGSKFFPAATDTKKLPGGTP